MSSTKGTVVRAALCCLLGLVVVYPAFAQGAGPRKQWYFDLNGGQSSLTQGHAIGNSIQAAVGQFGPYQSTNNVTASGRGISVGYSYNPYYAVELGYVTFGSASGTAYSTATPANALSYQLKGKGMVLNLIGTYPITSIVGVFGKLGAIRYHVRYDCHGGGAFTCVPPDSTSDGGLGSLWGVGVSLRIVHHFGLRLGWTQYRDIGNRETGGNGYINYTYLSAIIRF